MPFVPREEISTSYLNNYSSCPSTYIMSSIINNSVVRQVGGHQQCVNVLSLEAFHVGLGKVGVQIPRQVVIAGRELEAGCQVAYPLVRCRHRRQDWSVVAGTVPEYRAGIQIKEYVMICIWNFNLTVAMMTCLRRWRLFIVRIVEDVRLNRKTYINMVCTLACGFW